MSKIKKIKVLSLAKVQSIVMAIFGLIFGLFYSIIISFSTAEYLNEGGPVLILVLVVSIFIVPLFYGIIGFIIGALGAFIYNVIANLIGGIEIELEN